MTKYSFSLIAGVLIIFTFSLCTAQTVQSVTDSIVVYNFTTDRDSTQTLKRVIQKVDSILYYEYEERTLWDKDSSDWIPNLKTHRTFDIKGNLLFEESWRWNTAEKIWRNSKRYENLYDASGNQLMTSYYKWDSNNSIWYGSEKVTWAYDGKGNDTLTVDYDWNAGSEEWHQAYRTYRSYNEDHTLATKDLCPWNQLDSSWYFLIRSTYSYTYNENGKLDQRLTTSYNKNDDRWDPDQKEEYTYDDNGYLTSDAQYHWRDSEWHGDTRSVYICNEEGYRIASEIHYWDGAIKDWVGGLYRYAYEYDHMGNMILEILYKRESNSDPWFCLSEREINFDAAGRLTSDVTTSQDPTYLKIWRDDTNYTLQGRYSVQSSYEKDSLGGTYDRYTKAFYYWDGEGNNILDLCIDPARLSFVISGDDQAIEGQKTLYVAPEILNVEYHWEVENGTLLSGGATHAVEVEWNEPGQAMLSAYVENEKACKSDTASKQVQVGVMSIDGSPSIDLRLYPVPVKDLLHISTDLDIVEVEIVDQHGRSVMIFLSGKNFLDLTTLSSGIYLVLVKDRNGGLVCTRKILKE